MRFRSVCGVLFPVCVLALTGCVDDKKSPVPVTQEAQIEPGSECGLTIDSDSDWQRINDPDLRVFCVAPGDYSAVGTVSITESGDEARPRYLKAIEPAHPVHLTADYQAVVKQVELHASYWEISGIVIRGSGGNSINLASGASFNTLDRLLVEQSNGGGLYAKESSYNVLQNSVFRNPVPTPGRDSYHIYIDTSDHLTISGNELYNATGAVQQKPGSGGNHVIVNNDMYMTPESYTDCSGNPDPSGECSCGEMHIVLKGIAASDSIVTIEGNRIWGMRRNDPLCMSTGAPGLGIDLGSGANDTRNVVIRNNVIFDNHSYGIFLGAVVSDVKIQGNLLHGNEVGLASGYGKNIVTVENYFVGNDTNMHLYATHWGLSEANLDVERMESETCFTIKQITDPQIICLN